MFIESKIDKLYMTAATVHVELKSPASQSASLAMLPRVQPNESMSDREFFLVGFDLLSGAANISNGFLMGKTQVDPSKFEGDDPQAIERMAVYVVFDFLHQQQSTEESENA